MTLNRIHGLIALLIITLNSNAIEVGELKVPSGEIITVSFKGESIILLYLNKTPIFEYQSDTITTAPYICTDKTTGRSAVYFSEKLYNTDRESYYAIVQSEMGIWKVHWLSAQAEEYEVIDETSRSSNKSNCPLFSELEVALIRERMMSDLIYKQNADIIENHPLLLNFSADDLNQKLSTWKDLDENVAINTFDYKKYTLINLLVSVDLYKAINLVFFIDADQAWLIHQASGRYPDFEAATVLPPENIESPSRLQLSVNENTNIEILLDTKPPTFRLINTSKLTR